MPIIMPVLPDPTDIVIQGEQIIPQLFPPNDAPIALLTVIQGWESFAEIPPVGVPRAMIGQSDWYGILPRQIGPMAMGDPGIVAMLDIGNPVPPNPNIDPIQSWLNAPFPIDMTGMRFDLTPDMLGAFEATNAMVYSPNPPDDTPVVIIPRGAIFRSGLAKRITAPTLPNSFGQHLMELFTDSTQKYLISGVTCNAAGTPIGGCRVVVFETGKITANTDQYANPFAGETVSDGSGNFNLQMNDQGPYQLIAYLPGSPDIAGITVNNVTPAMG